MKKTHTSQKVSVITVVLNGKETIEKTICSVLGQAYPNLEYIIIDGGSIDGTLEIIKKYEDKINYWVSERDNGIYDAMNKGIKAASGEIINILNCGDVYENNFVVSDTVDIFKKNNRLSCVLGRGRFVDNKNQPVCVFKNQPLLTTLGFGKFDDCCHQAFFYKKELHQEFGLYDLNYKFSADRHFIQKIYASKKHPYFLLNKILAVRRYEGLSRKPEAMLENKKLYDEIFGKSLTNYFLVLKYYLRKSKLGSKVYKIYEKIKFLLSKKYNLKISENIKNENHSIKF